MVANSSNLSAIFFKYILFNTSYHAFSEATPPRCAGNNEFPRSSMISQILNNFWRMTLILFLNEDMKVLALSESSVAGRPRHPANLLKASRNVSTLNLHVSSKCMAWLDAYMNKHIIISLWIINSILKFSKVYTGSAKSNPMCENMRLYRWVDHVVRSCKQYGSSSSFLQVTHDLTIDFTTFLPLRTQYRQ